MLSIFSSTLKLAYVGQEVSLKLYHDSIQGKLHFFLPESAEESELVVKYIFVNEYRFCFFNCKVELKIFFFMLFCFLLFGVWPSDFADY